MKANQLNEILFIFQMVYSFFVGLLVNIIGPVGPLLLDHKIWWTADQRLKNLVNARVSVFMCPKP